MKKKPEIDVDRQLKKILRQRGLSKQQEVPFVRAVVRGLADVQAGLSVGLAEAKKKLGLT